MRCWRKKEPECRNNLEDEGALKKVQIDGLLTLTSTINYTLDG